MRVVVVDFLVIQPKNMQKLLYGSNMMLICSNIFCYHGSVLDPPGYMFDIICFILFLKTEKENVRTGRIKDPDAFLGTSQWNS